VRELQFAGAGRREWVRAWRRRGIHINMAFHLKRYYSVRDDHRGLDVNHQPGSGGKINWDLAVHTRWRAIEATGRLCQRREIPAPKSRKWPSC
jgi:hypothetical protein